MSFTWDPTDVSSSLAQVREAIGDIVSTNYYLTDEQINAELARQGDNIKQTSIACVRKILARIAKDIDKSGANVQSSRSQLTQQYRDLLRDLQADVSTMGGVRISGQSISENASYTEDTDAVQPAFSIGMDDNTRSYP